MFKNAAKTGAGTVFSVALALVAENYKTFLGHWLWPILAVSGLVFLWSWGITTRTGNAWRAFWKGDAVTDAKAPQVAVPVKEVAPSTPPPSLRDRIFQVCSELETFLAKHGKRPNPYLIPIADKNEYIRIYNETVQSWENKFQAEYWSKFKSRVLDLRHELAMDNVTDDDLDNRLNEADTSALGDVTVQGIDDGLRRLASRL